MNIADHNLDPNVQHASFSPAAARFRFLCTLGGLLCALLILYANTIVTALSQMKQRVCHTCSMYVEHIYYNIIVTTVHGARYVLYIADTYDIGNMLGL